ncbi:MAG: hypothetical protein BGO43_01350 [Gammaproteobacteria bacterium 39-13]|nr:MAG: hypothetical protein BGO43_01350 [Gammaproteobacteria bacterium 39-13]
MKLLPFSILSLVIYDFICFGKMLFPKHVPLFQQLSMFAVLLLLPAAAMLFPALDKIAKQQSFSVSDIFLLGASRFLSFMGSILSMVLLPLIILGICIGVYLFLSQKHVTYPYLFGWVMFSYFLILATMITKILAPILVLVDEQDANSSVDESDRLVKGYYFQTFTYVLYAILLLILLARVPQIIYGFFPALTKSIPSIWLEGLAQILLIIVGPWSFAFLLTHKYNLQALHPKPVAREKTPPQAKASKPKPVAQSATPLDKKTEDDKFNF